MILTYRYRIKDASTGRHLRRMARAVNFVWNYCGDIQHASRRLNRRWPTWVDLSALTSGTSKELGLQADTITQVCRQWAHGRDKARRRPRWRSRKSLGWIPFRASGIRMGNGTVRYYGRTFRIWESRPLGGEIKCGSFSEDASGRWYVNLQVEVAETDDCGTGAIGIDLGLKTLAALSDGSKIENPRHFDRHAKALARAQRAGRKARARAINVKIARVRRHYLHQHSTRLVRQFGKIVVGNVSGFTGKAFADASWSAFRDMLRYKAIAHGAEYVEANERYSSQTCSNCGVVGGPKGRKGLEIRAWVCGDCGAVHDRDVNAAVNLLLGSERRPPVVGIARQGEGVNPSEGGGSSASDA